MAQPEFAELYRLRAGIEATISQLVQRCGLRRSRYRGSRGRELHALLAGAGLNAWRLIACLLDGDGALPQAAGAVQAAFSCLLRALRGPLQGAVVAPGRPLDASPRRAGRTQLAPT